MTVRPERSVLRLARADLRRLVRWSVAARPREACGLLLGAEDRRGPSEVAVRRILLARNVASAPDRFEVDPGDVVRADRTARAAGMRIVGVWHSHPERPPRPSSADRAGAWKGISQLVLSVDDGGLVEARSYRGSPELVSEELRITIAVA